MAKCNRVIEIVDDGMHADCHEWFLYPEYSYNYRNIEVAKFKHTGHLERDKNVLLKIKENYP